MRSYSIVPRSLRELQDPDPGEILESEGSNAAAVLKRLSDENSWQYDRVCSILAAVVEGLRQVEYKSLGQKETLQFKQDVGLEHPWAFDAQNMSDGTLRLLGLLLAVYQPHGPSVLIIEEPEATIHPGAAEVVVQVLLDAARERQVLITTHSPDILDSPELRDDQIRVVTMARGNTTIAPISTASREAIRTRLFTAGELLRSDELNPDTRAAEAAAEQLRIFGAVPVPAADA